MLRVNSTSPCKVNSNSISDSENTGKHSGNVTHNDERLTCIMHEHDESIANILAIKKYFVAADRVPRFRL